MGHPDFIKWQMILLPGCPSQLKTAMGKITLAAGGSFRLLEIWNTTRFLAGTNRRKGLN